MKEVLLLIVLKRRGHIPPQEGTWASTRSGQEREGTRSRGRGREAWPGCGFLGKNRPGRVGKFTQV